MIPRPKGRGGLIFSANISAHTSLEGEVVAEIDYEQSLVVTYPGIGPCDFAYNGKRFYIIQDEIITKVKPAFVDKKLRGITQEQLLAFLDGGYLYVNQLGNGDFTITPKGRVRGGVIFLALGIVAFKVLAGVAITSAVPVAGSIFTMSAGTIATVIAKDIAKEAIKAVVKEVLPSPVNACLTLTPRVFPLPRPPVVRGFSLPKPPPPPVPGAPRPPILGAPRSV